MVHHAQSSAYENAYQEILGQYKLSVKVHHLAGTPHLTNDLPTGVTSTTVVACSGRPSLLQFVSQRKFGTKTPNMTRHSSLHRFIPFPELCVVF